MNQNMTFKIIVAAALTGAAYGIVGASYLEGESVPVRNLVMSCLGGGLIFATTASALCRIFRCCQTIRESANRPQTHELCYRGIPHGQPLAQVTDHSIVEVELVPSTPAASESLETVAANRNAADSARGAEFELMFVRRFDRSDKPKTFRLRKVSRDRLRQTLAELLKDSELI